MSRWNPSYHSACQIQNKVLNAMGLERQNANQTPKPMPNAPNLSPKDLCSLTAAWDTLENRKRILRGKGLPKAEEPAKRAKAPKAQTFSE